MIPNTHHQIRAQYIGVEGPSEGDYWTFPVVAWSDQGDALVPDFVSGSLDVASSLPGFVGLNRVIRNERGTEDEETHV